MSWIRVSYRVRASQSAVAAIAEALALEQSVELPAAGVHDAFVREHVMGRVESIRALEPHLHEVVVRLATATTGYDVAQTLNMLFGNSSLHEHVELADVDFPAEFLQRFRGPRYGIEGIRRLAAVAKRPLACAALKPQGLAPERLAALCRTLALGGIDIVKDDHGLADQHYAPFAQRVAACQRAIEHACRDTGRRALYAPSLVGSPRALAEQARIARDHGVSIVLVAPALVGMPAFAELADTLAMAVIAHPAYAGAARVAPALLLGRLFRWIGADAVVFPHFGGRFAYSQQTCAAIAADARNPLASWRPVLPVPAGGLAVERVPDVVRFYGSDAMLLIGGSLLGAGERLIERTREFVHAIESAGAGSENAETERVGIVSKRA
jgi:ribulose-bisphosphate carboxylase large chain